ncbi:MAG: hypothetical protein Q4C01_06250 [Clostridia bacterium]|nr:hypothetical protein [Clostridia bacterium]
MKSLKTVQAIFKVLKVLATVAAVFCLVGAVILIVSIAVIALLEAGDSSEFIKKIVEWTGEDYRFNELLATLCAAFTVCISGGLLSLFTLRYFKRELADGTPFTERGAKELLYLGIKHIVTPAVAVLIIAIICACCGVDKTEIDYDFHGFSGVGMILLSFVFKYGAELENKLKERDADKV